MEFEINAVGREKSGSNYARKFRREGFIPGVVYGHGERSRPILVPVKDLNRLLRHLKHDVVIVKLNVDSTWKRRCILKSVQVDPLTDQPSHVDFQILKKEPITIKVPVVLKGEAVGVKSGGILDHHLRELTIKVLPDRIPEHIEVDISQLGLGEALHIEDLPDRGFEYLDPPDAPVVSIIIPKKLEVVEVAPVAEEVVEEKEPKEEKEEKEETKS